MNSARYTARIGNSVIAEDASYESLLAGIQAFAVRAAIARSTDESEWEHEELRRRGIGGLEIFRNEKALWIDRECFEAELEEAKREQVEERFSATNELDPAFLEKLDRDLREQWRLAGYEVHSLSENMKALFVELESDAKERAAGAREALLEEILNSSRSRTD
jgi:hypothetical protein